MFARQEKSIRAFWFVAGLFDYCSAMSLRRQIDWIHNTNNQMGLVHAWENTIMTTKTYWLKSSVLTKILRDIRTLINKTAIELRWDWWLQSNEEPTSADLQVFIRTSQARHSQKEKTPYTAVKALLTADWLIHFSFTAPKFLIHQAQRNISMREVDKKTLLDRTIIVLIAAGCAISCALSLNAKSIESNDGIFSMDHSPSYLLHSTIKGI